MVPINLLKETNTSSHGQHEEILCCLAPNKTILTRTKGVNKQDSQNTLVLSLLSIVNMWISRFHYEVPAKKDKLSCLARLSLKLRCLEEILWTSEVPNCKMLSSGDGWPSSIVPVRKTGRRSFFFVGGGGKANSTWFFLVLKRWRAVSNPRKRRHYSGISNHHYFKIPW